MEQDSFLVNASGKESNQRSSTSSHLLRESQLVQQSLREQSFREISLIKDNESGDSACAGGDK